MWLTDRDAFGRVSFSKLLLPYPVGPGRAAAALMAIWFAQCLVPPMLKSRDVPLLTPGVEMEVDPGDPTSGNADDAWRQSCADSQRGNTYGIRARLEPDRIRTRRCGLHARHHLAVTRELEDDPARRFLAWIVDTDGSRRSLHHDAAQS